MQLHPQLIEKSGKNEFVVLPYEEFQVLMECMDDYEDLLDLRKAKKEEKGKKGIPLDKVINELGI